MILMHLTRCARDPDVKKLRRVHDVTRLHAALLLLLLLLRGTCGSRVLLLPCSKKAHIRTARARNYKVQTTLTPRNPSVASQHHNAVVWSTFVKQTEGDYH